VEKLIPNQHYECVVLGWGKFMGDEHFLDHQSSNLCVSFFAHELQMNSRSNLLLGGGIVAVSFQQWGSLHNSAMSRDKMIRNKMMGNHETI
jgi:hypothetical protein